MDLEKAKSQKMRGRVRRSIRRPQIFMGLALASALLLSAIVGWVAESMRDPGRFYSDSATLIADLSLDEAKCGGDNSAGSRLLRRIILKAADDVQGCTISQDDGPTYLLIVIFSQRKSSKEMVSSVRGANFDGDLVAGPNWLVWTTGYPATQIARELEGEIVEPTDSP